MRHPEVLRTTELTGSVREKPVHKLFYDPNAYVLHRGRNLYPKEWTENGHLIKNQKFILQRHVLESTPEFWRDVKFGKQDIKFCFVEKYNIN